jgi:hypothetical protein
MLFLARKNKTFFEPVFGERKNNVKHEAWKAES